MSLLFGKNVLTFGDKMSLFPSNKGGWGPKFRKAAGGGKVPNLAKANFQRLKAIAALIFTKFLIFIIDF